MKLERKTVTLSDGTAVVFRKLNQVDHWEAREVPDEGRRVLFLLSRAALLPRIEVRGLPGLTDKPADGMLHVLDLPDEDLNLLLKETNDFALGGARREQFPAGSNGGSAPSSPAGDDLPEAPARDRAPSD